MARQRNEPEEGAAAHLKDEDGPPRDDEVHDEDFQFVLKELLGYPKKLGVIDWKHDVSRIEAVASRRGGELIRMRVVLGKLPLPAWENVSVVREPLGQRTTNPEPVTVCVVREPSGGRTLSVEPAVSSVVRRPRASCRGSASSRARSSAATSAPTSSPPTWGRPRSSTVPWSSTADRPGACA